MRQDWRIIGLFVGGVLVLGAVVGGPLLYSIKLSFYAAASFIDSAAVGRDSAIT
jgi:multiple sugar transport system permease protein